jgi:hypothetical protein
VATALALSACSSFSVPLDRCPSLHSDLPPEEKVVVRFLGVGGFLMRHGDDVVMTSPLYTNPSLLEVGANHTIRTDTELVDALLPADAKDTQAILVGHSHYDHLMDVPYIALHKCPRADIYGSETTKNLLAPIADDLSGKPVPTRVITVDEHAGDGDRPGRWIPVGDGIRIMALRSEHSAQATLPLPLTGQKQALHMWRGRVTEPFERLPQTASEWTEGRTYAYVIDFLGSNGERVFRVYFQDSGTREGTGYLPEPLSREGVDLALLCVGGDMERLGTHPEGIVRNTRPRFVLCGHWEDFFVTQTAHEYDGRVWEIPPASEGKTAAFEKRVRSALPCGSQVWIPCPTRSVFEFPIRRSR